MIKELFEKTYLVADHVYMMLGKKSNSASKCKLKNKTSLNKNYAQTLKSSMLIQIR